MELLHCGLRILECGLKKITAEAQRAQRKTTSIQTFAYFAVRNELEFESVTDFGFKHLRCEF
jgi:hypothetical protein